MVYYMSAKCDVRTSNPHEMDNHSSIHKRKAEEPYDGLSQKSRRIALKNRMYALKWHYRGVPNLLHCFTNYREKMQRRLAWYLQKRGLLKYYFIIKVTFMKICHEGDIDELCIHFHSGVKRLLRIEDFMDQYDESCQRIWQKLVEFLMLGSKLKSIEEVKINIFKYSPCDCRTMNNKTRCKKTFQKGEIERVSKYY